MANPLVREFRKSSEGLTQAANNLFTGNDIVEVVNSLLAVNREDPVSVSAVTSKVTSLVNARTAALIGKVNATTYSIMADVLEYLDEQRNNGVRSERIKSVVTRTSEIRNAAARASATGNWDEFDRLVSASAPNIRAEEGSGTTEIPPSG